MTITFYYHFAFPTTIAIICLFSYYNGVRSKHDSFVLFWSVLMALENCELAL